MSTGTDVTADRVEQAVALADGLVDAWGSWCPTMTPDARRVAFLSDRSGLPQVWVQDVVLDGPIPPARRIRLSDDPVVSVSWAADSGWLACEVATDGGVRTHADLLYAYFRLAARDQTIKPGDYAVTRGMTPGDLLGKLVRGDRIVLAVTLVEGWTFRQFREALAKAEHLRHDTAALTVQVKVRYGDFTTLTRQVWGRGDMPMHIVLMRWGPRRRMGVPRPRYEIITAHIDTDISISTCIMHKVMLMRRM